MTSTNSEILDKLTGLLFFQVMLPCKDVCWHSLPFASAIFFPTHNYPYTHTSVGYGKHKACRFA